jgi:Outer membrane protein beta-barrel domain
VCLEMTNVKASSLELVTGKRLDVQAGPTSKEEEMKMIKTLTIVVTLLCLSFSVLEANAQSDEVPKFELGAQFTSITKPDHNNGATEPGFGGWFTFNLNRSVAFEAVGNFFPKQCSFCGGGPVFGDNSGNITQGLFGVKAGKRFQRWGVFGKARPGVVSFSRGDSRFELAGTNGFSVIQSRRTNFALDLGGVLEFYPSKRIVTRFEAGDTMIHYGQRQSNFLSFDPTTGAPVLIPFTTKSETRHNVQFSAGVGWRF